MCLNKMISYLIRIQPEKYTLRRVHGVVLLFCAKQTYFCIYFKIVIENLVNDIHKCLLYNIIYIL